MEIAKQLEKQSWGFFGEWVKENPEFPYSTDDMIAFASFILQKQGWKEYSDTKIELNIGKAKIVFDKSEIEIQDLLCLYEDLENYLRSMHGVYL
jgi:hypothetical protein